MTKRGKGFSEIYDLSAVRIIATWLRIAYQLLAPCIVYGIQCLVVLKTILQCQSSICIKVSTLRLLAQQGARLKCRIIPKKCTVWNMALRHIGAIKKRAVKGSDSFDKQIAWLREMVDWQDETKGSREFLKSLKTDLDPTEVFVFTPKAYTNEFTFWINAGGFCVRHPYRSRSPLCGSKGKWIYRSIELSASNG